MHLVTWNTQWCRGLDGIVSPKRIVETARAMADFDVLCLQEIAQGFGAMPGAPGDQPAQLAALLPGFRVLFGPAVHRFGPDGGRRRFGNLIATRLPVTQVEHHGLPWPVDVSVTSMPRSCSVVTVLAPDLGAVRVMTTHLEYYSAPQRLAQARALHALHAEAGAWAAAPPAPPEPDSPFDTPLHTPHAILCGDFNAPAADPAYAAICAPIEADGASLHDAWPLVHGAALQPPTFRLYDKRYGRAPVACDFVFVSQALAPHVRHIAIDGDTRASDHQPVAVAFG